MGLARCPALLLAALCAACLACGNSVPLGPDLVSCQCACTTETPSGANPGSNGCNGTCDPPCPGDLMCVGNGACSSSPCLPNPPQDNLGQTTTASLHVCVDASNPSDALQACSDRCDAYANGSLLQCVNGLLVALGLEQAGGDTIPFDITAKINPSAAESLAELIYEECGTWLWDTLTGTCGLEQTGFAALVDLLLCVWSPVTMSANGVSAVRTCNLVPDDMNNLYEVVQKNGCPQFINQPDGGQVAQMPVGGGQLGAQSTVVSGSSLVSLSGADVTAASGHPVGQASTGRIGPILLVSELSGSLPDGHITVKGHDVTLSGAFLMLKTPVGAALQTGNAFSISSGRMHVIVTGNVNGQETSIDAVNTDAVTGQYDERSGTFLLSGSLGLTGLNAQVNLELTFGFTNRPPIANAGPDLTVECSLTTHEGIAHLDATQSFDPDVGDSISNYVWTVDREQAGAGPNAAKTDAKVGLGNRLATLATVDTHGAVSRDTALVNVVDTTPPVFDSVVVNPSCLWPPNHELVLLRLGQEIQVQVHDACDASPLVFVESVTSDEPPLGAGSGHTQPDVINGSAAVCLRAERAGNEQKPRTYTITLGAVDFSGNQSHTTVQVVVPHDEGQGKCPMVSPALVVGDGNPACRANVPTAPSVPKPTPPSVAKPNAPVAVQAAAAHAERGGCAGAPGGFDVFALAALAGLARRRRVGHRR